MSIRRSSLPHNRNESQARSIAALHRRLTILEGNPFIRSTSDMAIHGAAIGQGDDGTAEFEANVTGSSITAGSGGHSVLVTSTDKYQTANSGVVTTISLSESSSSSNTGIGISHNVQSSKGPSSQMAQDANSFALTWPGTQSQSGGGTTNFLANPEADEPASDGTGAAPVTPALTEPMTIDEHPPYTMTMDVNGVTINAPVSIADELTVNGEQVGGNSQGVVVNWTTGNFNGNGTDSVTFDLPSDNPINGQTVLFAPAVPFLDASAAWAGELHSEDPGNGGTTFPVRATRSDGIFDTESTYSFIALYSA